MAQDNIHDIMWDKKSFPDIYALYPYWGKKKHALKYIKKLRITVSG